MTRERRRRGAIHSHALVHTILKDIPCFCSPCHLHHVPESPLFNHNLSLGFFFQYHNHRFLQVILVLKMSGYNLPVNDSAARAKARKLIEVISEENFHVDDKEWEELGASNPKLRARLQSTFSRLREIAGHSVKT